MPRFTKADLLKCKTGKQLDRVLERDDRTPFVRQCGSHIIRPMPDGKGAIVYTEKSANGLLSKIIKALLPFAVGLVFIAVLWSVYV